MVGEAADEATALLSAVQGILKTVEGLLVSGGVSWGLSCGGPIPSE